MRARVIAVALVGCPGKREYKPLPPSAYERPPEPPYVTVREGRPPYPVPNSERARLGMVEQVILSIDSKNKYLEEAATDLGS